MSLFLALAWLAGACSPVPTLGLPGTGQEIPPIVGRVYLEELYVEVDRKAQVSTGEIASGATLELIDTTTSNTAATTVSDRVGFFSLNVKGFVPKTAPYYLEAVKGLYQHRAGYSAARLRTLVQFSGGTWQTMTTGNVAISRGTTALSVIASLRQSTSPAVNPVDLLGTLSSSSEPPAFDPKTSGITQAEYLDVYDKVLKSLAADSDPLAMISYDSGASQYLLLIKTMPQIGLMSPDVVSEGTLVTLLGQNFDSAMANNEVWFNSTKVIPTSGDTTRLNVVAPAGVSSGVLKVHTALGDSNTTPFTVVRGFGGLVK